MTELVSFGLSIGGLILFVLLGVIWVYARPSSRLARRVALTVTVLYALATVYAVSFALNRLLVFGFSPLAAADVPPGRTVLVVLGSGSYTIRDWGNGEYSTADPTAASRALEAARVYKLVDPAWVISSGGKRRPDDVDQATGIAIGHLLLQFGVPADRLITETTSRNTHDESVIVASMLPELKVEHVVLVTSETHMRRSLGTFRAAGIAAIPAVAREPFPPRSLADWLVPSADGLWGANQFVHEVLGIGYYAARGWYR